MRGEGRGMRDGEMKDVGCGMKVKGCRMTVER